MAGLLTLAESAFRTSARIRKFSELRDSPPTVLESFWRGIGKAGGLNLGVAIVGYSLPEHDDYAKQALYKVVKNFQGYYWEEPIAGRRKRPVLMIDRKLDPESATSYRQRYAFVDARKAHFHLGGFDQEAIRLIRAPDDDLCQKSAAPKKT